MSAIAIDHGWYAERMRAIIGIHVTALAGIYALIRDSPAALTPELAAAIDAIAAASAGALRLHHATTTSDFTRPDCADRHGRLCPTSERGLVAIPFSRQRLLQ